MIVNVIIAYLLIASGIAALTAVLFFPSLFFLNSVIPFKSGESNHAFQTIDGNVPNTASSTPMKAVVFCNTIAPGVKESFAISGFSDCRTLETQFNGNSTCKHGCLGLGSCIRICPSDAIVITKTSIRITQDCTGCGLCINVCPKRLIDLVPADFSPMVSCKAALKGDLNNTCPTALKDYQIDISKTIESSFNILQPWSIIAIHQRNRRP